VALEVTEEDGEIPVHVSCHNRRIAVRRKGDSMPRYMVERHLPGFTQEQLPGAAGAAKSTSEQLSHEGTPVRYLRSTFVPQEEKCFCLFEGDSEETIRTVQERAGLPYDRIVEANFITADEV
jgi:hypothetical protein